MIPRHVAFIMDGNGRWAKERGLPRNRGHRAGTDNLKRIIKYARAKEIEYLTFYAFSTENFSRPLEEVQFLFSLISEYFQREIQEMIDEGMRVVFLGDLTLFPLSVRKVLKKTQELTAEGKSIQVNIALGYGARAEILSAVNALLKEGVAKADEELFSSKLYTAGMPDPDLIIRTSGELRLSNFLLYQSAYSELYFTDLFWPDFDTGAFEKALEEYGSRSRRYGGIEEK
ncbi:MAG: polyprenyl diphosphate synthase [Bacillota bacterium]|nr:polyprenyl diphosphate synthase [Bacillota bacterium]